MMAGRSQGIGGKIVVPIPDVAPMRPVSVNREKKQLWAFSRSGGMLMVELPQVFGSTTESVTAVRGMLTAAE